MIIVADRGGRDEPASTLTGRLLHPTVIGLCEACQTHDATETVTFADGLTFAVCGECSP